MSRAPDEPRDAPARPDLIGREAEIAALFALLDRGERLITLAGTAGVGKTTVAARVAELSLARFAAHSEGGAWWCDLTEARDRDEVCGVVAAALGAAVATGGADLVAHVGRAIAARGAALLVLDNFEQVVEHAPATVGRWMAQAPDARFLVTSREQLRLPREVVCELAPLSLAASPAAALESDAVRLLVERTARARRQYAPGAADLAALAEIARQLDGLPLALELAAARLRVLAPAALLERLDRPLDLLSHGARGATARQRTLRGAIEWSWNLLEPAERLALAQCAVFRGGFVLDAAEHVVELSSAEPGAPPPVLDVVQALRDKSLLAAPAGTARERGEARLALYLSIREYAAERLAEAPAARDAAERRHAAYYAREGERRAERAARAGDAGAYAWLADERENLLAVAERALGRPGPLAADDATAALRALLALDPVATARGTTAAHVALLGAALDAAPAELDPALRTRALLARTDLCRRSDDPAGTRAGVDALLAEARARGDRVTEGRAVTQRALRAVTEQRYPDAVALLEQALALHRAAGERADVATVLASLSEVLKSVGDDRRSREMFEQAVAVSDALGWDRSAATTLSKLGRIAAEFGRHAEAGGYFKRALTISRWTGNELMQAFATYWLGLLDHVEERLADAGESYEDAARRFHELGERTLESVCLREAARVLVEQGRDEDADRAMRAAREVRPPTGDPVHDASYLAGVAAFEAARGRVDAADAAFREAAARAATSGSPTARAAVELERAHLDLALAARAAGGERASLVARAAARMAAARAPDSGEPPLVERSVNVRLSLRVLERTARALATAAATAPVGGGAVAAAPSPAREPGGLLVAADGRWFQLPTGERVECRERRAMRGLLARLAAERVTAPGRAVDQATLLAAGWPGERMLAQAATNRLHVTLSALRAAGLRPYLHASEDGGYLLDPATPVEISS